MSSSSHTYIYKCWGVAILVSLSVFARAQTIDTPDSLARGPYAIVVYVGGGLSRFVGLAGTPTGFNAAVNKNGVAGTLRLMWHPDHRLRFGIESGWTNFYSYEVNGGTNAATVKLTGVPILLVFSMSLTKHLNVFAGSGAYLLTSDLDYQSAVESHGLSVGFMASAMYTVPLSDRVSLAAEVKWFNARETKDTSLSLQLLAIWKLHQW